MICSQIPENENVEIVLMGSGSEDSLARLNGFIKDVVGFLKLQGKKANIRFKITNDYGETQNSDIVLCSAGKWATEVDKQKYQKQDPSGRLVQSFVNAEMIEQLTLKLKENCPNALFTIVTNQVDIMSHVARKNAPEMQIIGLSGGVDSSRLKQVIREQLGVESSGVMIGFHNGSMTPLTKSIKTQDKLIFPLLAGEEVFSDDDLQEEFLEQEQTKFETMISRTKQMGEEISREQRTGLDSGLDTGASILPATALTQLVNGYCFEVPFIESYNIFIKNHDVAYHFGVPVNTELSIPLEITKSSLIQSTRIPLLETEKVKMREAQSLLQQDLDLLYS